MAKIIPKYPKIGFRENDEITCDTIPNAGRIRI
jgi:hypothetical protein